MSRGVSLFATPSKVVIRGLDPRIHANDRPAGIFPVMVQRNGAGASDSNKLFITLAKGRSFG